MKKQLSLFIIVLIFSASDFIVAQEKSGLETQADKLHKSYQFDEAIVIYNKILEQSTDSLYKVSIEKKLIMSENGKALLEFASTPEVIASAKYKISDFFLHYTGFPNQSWVPVPKELAETTINIPISGNLPVMYFPNESNKLIYSAPDDGGSWNLYSTHKLNDTLWSAPVMLNENISSVGNELFPYLTPDGKTLYFSSNGHYGMGGYDLYVSTWDEDSNDWDIAQNMGFPFSSVGNDFLFYNTPDGLFSIFSSTRDNIGEDITVYALKYEATPLKKSIPQPRAELLSHLRPPSDKTSQTEDNPTEEGNDQTSAYTTAVKEVRRLQQEIKNITKQQKENRALYNTLTNSDDLALLEKKIAEIESKTLEMQQNLNKASADLQKVEIDFLSKGIIITQTPEEQTENKENSPLANFKFADNSMGATPVMIVEVPEPTVDLSFKISDLATVADIADFPNGLVYQIQLFVVTKKPSLKALKGLSPVFERKGPTGKYFYSAGIFYSYEDAMKHINKVKKIGFPSAIITAFNNGKSIPTKSARALEQKEKESVIYQIVIEGYETLPAEALKAIRDNTEKDIAKSIENNTTKYVVGPFKNKAEADSLKESLEKTGILGTQVEKVAKN